jgi:hypothetical protein
MNAPDKSLLAEMNRKSRGLTLDLKKLPSDDRKRVIKLARFTSKDISNMRQEAEKMIQFETGRKTPRTTKGVNP